MSNASNTTAPATSSTPAVKPMTDAERKAAIMAKLAAKQNVNKPAPQAPSAPAAKTKLADSKQSEAAKAALAKLEEKKRAKEEAKAAREAKKAEPKRTLSRALEKAQAALPALDDDAGDIFDQAVNSLSPAQIANLIAHLDVHQRTELYKTSKRTSLDVGDRVRITTHRLAHLIGLTGVITQVRNVRAFVALESGDRVPVYCYTAELARLDDESEVEESEEASTESVEPEASSDEPEAKEVESEPVAESVEPEAKVG
jgi:hypothetical protein